MDDELRRKIAKAICYPGGCECEWDGPLMQARPLICHSIVPWMQEKTDAVIAVLKEAAAQGRFSPEF